MSWSLVDVQIALSRINNAIEAKEQELEFEHKLLFELKRRKEKLLEEQELFSQKKLNLFEKYSTQDQRKV